MKFRGGGREEEEEQKGIGGSGRRRRRSRRKREGYVSVMRVRGKEWRGGGEAALKA